MTAQNSALLQRIIILGAGRATRGGLPAAAVQVTDHRSVLTWLLDAFAVIMRREVWFVGGYMAESIINNYPDVHIAVNSDWAVTGPVRSLSMVPLESAISTYVCYGDVIFRSSMVDRMEATEADVVVAVDSRWRARYDGRSRAELDNAEKVRVENGRLVDVGKHICTNQASGQFGGLVRLSATAVEHLRTAIVAKVFSDKAGIPEVLAFLLNQRLTSEIVDIKGDWAELDAPQDLARFVLGTKAESLARLKPLLRTGCIGELVSFSQEEWRSTPQSVCLAVRRRFAGKPVIVRSSARVEDGWDESCAGAFRSVLDISADDTERLIAAINDVFRSYGDVQPDNQVLIQEMLTDVRMSGVIMTRTPSLGAPYYVMNFDNTTAKTDAVTAGNAAHIRTVYVLRSAPLRRDLPDGLDRVIRVVKELEYLVGHDSLDIEFAVASSGEVYVLQVRPITVARRNMPVDDRQVVARLQEAVEFFRIIQRPSPTLVGRSTVLSVMSDWNPAEMIGTKPKRLAASLYRYLITDEVWASQRAEYGYRDVRPCNLLWDIAGHQYVDVRAVFNSFIPADIPDQLAEKLVNHYVRYLSHHPHLHDKVEFEVLITCLTFDFDTEARRLSNDGFDRSEIEQLRRSLGVITLQGINRCERELSRHKILSDRFTRIAGFDCPPLTKAHLLLEDARRFGTPPFAHLARSAFIATALLKSLQRIGILSKEDVARFLASIRTVPSAMQTDARLVAQGSLGWREFVDRYGHLRPGTYDITSPCYASAPEEYLEPMVRSAGESPDGDRDAEWSWALHTREQLDSELDRIGLGMSVSVFEAFMRQAIYGREFSKFWFTRNVSTALELLAEFGAQHGCSREDLAHIEIADLLRLRGVACDSSANVLRRLSESGKNAYYVTQAISLPPEVLSEADMTCFEQCLAAPNYVTNCVARGLVVSLSGQSHRKADLSGKIVLVACADPGFDWLFARGIAGLITMYGGANSHMAVRAAEFGLPAAIGVGELLFERLCNAEMLELDCGSRRIDIVRENSCAQNRSDATC